ncbi:hypothetical protein QCN29_32440 [Streptomyces sp. HNM0663]|uniref:DUF2637 domain-containing protein n=1 Tax=Streptomyces chengmaiensis TaxID=3040919 RepID=A0ABT6HYQ1_9ACTN|nr:hypothetical protein [Streptomyces chengmaiensis]MDH2393393.1 hypothetical protein [Streptomyces chengmaiensis]
MSITDFRTAKREDQEARARQAREDEELRARLSREEKQQAFEQEQARQAAEQEAKDREAERIRKERKGKADAELAKKQAALAAKVQADKERRREKARRRKERRERFVAQVNAAPKWLAEQLDLAAALAVMACSIAPALISQASSLKDTGLVVSMGWLGWLLVTLLPVMLECSAWAATAGEAKAMKQKRSPWPYRIAVYCFASLAASVNYWHGADIGGKTWGVALGSVLAASSIIPIIVWQLVQLGRHRAYRDEMEDARQARKDAKKTRKVRKKELPKVWETAVRLRAIAGYERLSEEDAWLVAYGVYEGAVSEMLSDELLRLLSADMLGNLVDAEGRRSVVLEELTAVRLERQKLSETLSAKAPENDPGRSVDGSAEGAVTLPTRVFEGSSTGLVIRPGTHQLRTVSPQINTSVPPSAHTSETAPARTRDTSRPRTRKARATNAVRKLSPGAKKAAAETAKAASTDENAAIEAWVLTEIQAGRIPSRKGVEEETVRRRKDVHGVKAAAKLGVPSKTWCYDRISKAKAARGPRLVSDQRSA